MTACLRCPDAASADAAPQRERRRLLAGLGGIGLALTGCVAAPSSSDSEAGAEALPIDLTDSPWGKASRVSSERTTQWRTQTFPGKRQTLYEAQPHDGRVALRATARQSASMVRTQLRAEPQALGRLRFSWWLPQLIQTADMGEAATSDSPVRVVLAFEGDRSKFSPRDAMLSELARVLTGEDLPYATLNYVWCNTRPVGTVLSSRRTDRVRKLVVQSGEWGLRRWLDFDRDIRADFELAFGEAPGALVSAGVMTDTDNTESTIQAWYGPVSRV